MRRFVPLFAAALLAGCAVSRGWLHRSDIALGRRVYVDKGCYGCHTMHVTGTPIAPDLSHIGAAHDRRWLLAWLRDPRPSHMPRIEMSAHEREALAEYLATLR